MPPGLRRWLQEQRSLTRRLERHCQTRFRLRLLGQSRRRPLLDEREALDMRRGRVGLIRRVQLLCGEEPMVFARSVIPLGTLTGANGRLARLGTRPLADILFAGQVMQRLDMAFALLRTGESLHQQAADALSSGDGDLWARRSLFLLNRRPLLVTEVFSPEIDRAR